MSNSEFSVLLFDEAAWRRVARENEALREAAMEVIRRFLDYKSALPPKTAERDLMVAISALSTAVLETVKDAPSDDA